VSLIGVVKEQQGESRVAATPETVKVIRSLGYDVVVENGA
jgi:NAD(P) transhydrogenase subunit alpha